VCQVPGFEYNIDGDAIETPLMVNLGDQDLIVQVGVELYEGASPNYLKYVWFDLDAGVFSVDEYDTASGTVFGHANAAGAEAGGASAWYQTEEWGSPLRPQCVPACLNSLLFCRRHSGVLRRQWSSSGDSGAAPEAWRHPTGRR
jgi:hypothetical protein